MEPTEDETPTCGCAAHRAGLADELAANLRTLRLAVTVINAIELADPFDPAVWAVARNDVFEAAETLNGTLTLIRAVQ